MHRCVAKCSGSVPSGNIAKVHNVKWIHTEFRKHLILTKKEGRISLKKRISLLVMLFISILAVTGCRAKEAADSLEISFKDYEFGDVDRICLGFEMQSAYIKSEPAIALFQELSSEVSGSHGTSSQGYADGGYSISMMSGEKEVFTIQISENSILFGNTNNPLFQGRNSPGNHLHKKSPAMYFSLCLSYLYKYYIQRNIPQSNQSRYRVPPP